MLDFYSVKRCSSYQTDILDILQCSINKAYIQFFKQQLDSHTANICAAVERVCLVGGDQSRPLATADGGKDSSCC